MLRKCTYSITCNVMLETGRARRRHAHEKHGPLPNICSLCKEPFITARSLEQHHGNYDHNKIRTPKTPRRRRKKAKNTSLGSAEPCVATQKKSRRPKKEKTSTDNVSGVQGLSNPSHRIVNSRAELSLTYVPDREPPARQDIVKMLLEIPTRDKSGINSLTPANIDTFIANNVQPNSGFLDTCGEGVDILVNYLQHNAPERVRPRRVIKGGSLGKGTAVKGKSDADIVIMLNNYTDVNTMVVNIEKILQDIEKTIKDDPRFTFKGRTHRAVQVEVKTRYGHKVEADILPAVDVTDLKSRTEIYNDMKYNYSNRDYYSPCLAPLQSKLFAGIPTKLKSLIRLVKYWKKEKLVKENFGYHKRWPTSYVTELIVLNAWEQAGEPTSFDMTRGLHAVLTSIVNHDSFRVVFDPQRRFYDKQFLPTRMPATYIMDPCNPFNDVYNNGGWAWDAYANKAQEWLHQSLFQNIRNSEHDWQ